MESFPGTFPNLYSRDTHDNDLRSNTPYNRQNTQSNISPELIHVQKSLITNRNLFIHDLIFQLDCLTYAYFFITYIYDCSLLLLVLKFLVQSSILIFYWTPALENLIPSDALFNSKRSSLYGIVLINAFSVLLHVTRNLPIPDENGFIYGHHTLQIIGQYQLNNKYWLLAFDAICFVLQTLVFSTQIHSKNQENTLRSSLIEIEYDGTQGSTIAAKLNFCEALKPSLISVNELKTSEVRRQSREEILDFLVNNPNSQQYGSINPSTLT